MRVSRSIRVCLLALLCGRCEEEPHHPASASKPAPLQLRRMKSRRLPLPPLTTRVRNTVRSSTKRKRYSRVWSGIEKSRRELAARSSSAWNPKALSPSPWLPARRTSRSWPARRSRSTSPTSCSRWILRGRPMKEQSRFPRVALTSSSRTRPESQSSSAFNVFRTLESIDLSIDVGCSIFPSKRNLSVGSLQRCRWCPMCGTMTLHRRVLSPPTSWDAWNPFGAVRRKLRFAFELILEPVVCTEYDGWREDEEEGEPLDGDA